MMNNTGFDTKCLILTHAWEDYKSEEVLNSFIAYYSVLSLPLAYLISNEYVVSTPRAEELINEAFDFLLGALDIEDIGFATFEDMLIESWAQDN